MTIPEKLILKNDKNITFVLQIEENIEYKQLV